MIGVKKSVASEVRDKVVPKRWWTRLQLKPIKEIQSLEKGRDNGDDTLK